MGLIALSLIYLAFDSTLGRQKLQYNLFLAGGAVESVIEQFNEGVLQGRGPIDLLGAVAMFIPFALFDGARRAAPRLALAARIVGGTFLFYEVGVSRGFALVAILAVSLGSGSGWKRWVWGGGVALTVFGLSSLYRGDFTRVAFSNPLFDAVAWPFVNLSLLTTADCGSASWLAFVGEFGRKFLPAFAFTKEVFPFNMEMTRCVYPFFGDYVESVSIFTYLGEFVYYTPSWLTALVAGGLLALLVRVDDGLSRRSVMTSTRAFAGLMCIVLLRSRIQDAFSFLLFLLVFLLAWRSGGYAFVHLLRSRGAISTSSAALPGK